MYEFPRSRRTRQSDSVDSVSLRVLLICPTLKKKQIAANLYYQTNRKQSLTDNKIQADLYILFQDWLQEIKEKTSFSMAKFGVTVYFEHTIFRRKSIGKILLKRVNLSSQSFITLVDWPELDGAIKAACGESHCVGRDG